VPRAGARFGQRAVTETMMSGDDNDLTTLLENHLWLLEMRPAIESIANTDADVQARRAGYPRGVGSS
jgi:hypothetical protein